jgi:hypothetical protein
MSSRHEKVIITDMKSTSYRRIAKAARVTAVSDATCHSMGPHFLFKYLGLKKWQEANALHGLRNLGCNSQGLRIWAWDGMGDQT